MAYDVTKLKDWQIAEAAEANMPTVEDWREKLSLKRDELIPYGRLSRLDFAKIYKRLKKKPNGKYIEVTAITPTPLGEGKTTTTMGLLEGLGKRGKSAGGCIRQPSGGPTMNIKGTAAGGGNALLIPMTEFSMGLTGEINDIMNAHNLAMVALNARMQHERNYDDEQLQKLSHMRRLDIDPDRVQMGWVIDFCAQGLRNIMTGLGGSKDGFTMRSKFEITPSSELMAILSVAKDLKDVRERIDNITIAFSKSGEPVTIRDLEVGGAMTAWLRNAINPTLCCTVEYQPCMVHTGPFANIAIGQSSIVADLLGLKMFDYHVTESGFATDMGFEKFWNVKCRLSGLRPHVSVLTTTVRALKMHGGGPAVVAGKPLPDDYHSENLALLEKGLPNLLHHINIVKKSGVNVVVCINCFSSDTKAEIAMVKKAAEGAGVRCTVANHWEKGGDGALDLADAVIEACEKKVDFKFLYPQDMKLRKKVDKIAKEIYGADGVSWTPEAEAKAKSLEADRRYDDYSTVMVKTQFSLSHEPTWKGVPAGWTLPIRDVLIYTGAKFICPVSGDISLMPGTGSNPSFRRIDVDTDTGRVIGLA
ncbi:MAG: formate--tetrahydrofolate ligase [Dehalococcoidia bacterium]